MVADNKKKPRGFGRLGKVGGVMAIVDGAFEFRHRQSTMPDESPGKSFAFAAGTVAAWTLAPGAMAGYTAMQIGKDYGESTANAQKAWRQGAWDRSRATFGGEFQDSQVGATMRQRGMQAIEKSRMQASSHLANEARSLHRF